MGVIPTVPILPGAALIEARRPGVHGLFLPAVRLDVPAPVLPIGNVEGARWDAKLRCSADDDIDDVAVRERSSETRESTDNGSRRRFESCPPAIP